MLNIMWQNLHTKDHYAKHVISPQNTNLTHLSRISDRKCDLRKNGSLVGRGPGVETHAGHLMGGVRFQLTIAKLMVTTLLAEK